jgi:hypothetical protein
MNSNPMGTLAFIACLVLSIIALVGAKGIKWKLLNLVIILGFMAASLVIGFGFGVWGNSQTVGANVAVVLMPWLGLVGALGCIRRNKRREKQSSTPTF